MVPGEPEKPGINQSTHCDSANLLKSLVGIQRQRAEPLGPIGQSDRTNKL
jgi:hypothetical protein